MSGKGARKKTAALPSAAKFAERVAEAHKIKKQKREPQSDSDDELNQSVEKSGEESETSDSSSASAAQLRRTLKIREEVADKARKLDDAEKATESLDAVLHKQDAINEKKVRQLSEKRNSYPSEIEVNVL
jgi:hypothetical protein